MEVRISADDFLRLGQHLSGAPSWAPHFVTQNMEQLGRRIAYLMGMQLKRHTYTGALGESVRSAYNPAEMKLEVGPTAKRGQYDAGLLLQRGTRPIPNLPFGPIAKWAAFRGLPAGPIWMSIKEKGVTAHPFLEETLARGDTQVAIKHTAQRIGIDLAGAAVQILNGIAINSGGAVFGGTR